MTKTVQEAPKSRLAKREEARLARASAMIERQASKNAGLDEVSTAIVVDSPQGEKMPPLDTPPISVQKTMTKPHKRHGRRKFLDLSVRPSDEVAINIGVKLPLQMERELAQFCLKSSSAHLVVNPSMVMDAALGSVPHDLPAALEIALSDEFNAPGVPTRRVQFVVRQSHYEPFSQWSTRLHASGLHNAGVGVGQLYIAALGTWLRAQTGNVGEPISERPQHSDQGATGPQ